MGQTRFQLPYYYPLDSSILNAKTRSCGLPLTFGVLLQIRFQVQSVSYPPIPVEQPKESKPFATMVIMVSSSFELLIFKVFHLQKQGHLKLFFLWYNFKGQRREILLLLQNLFSLVRVSWCHLMECAQNQLCYIVLWFFQFATTRQNSYENNEIILPS